MRAARVALTAIVAIALLIVLGPLPVGGLDAWHRLLLHLSGAVPAVPLVTRNEAEALANVVMFVPLGLLLPLALPRLSLLRVLMGLVLASAALEVVQRVALSTRTPSVLDVLTNGLGALLGIALAALVRERSDRR